MEVLEDGSEDELARLLDTEPPHLLTQGTRLTTLNPEGRVLTKKIRVMEARFSRIVARLHELDAQERMAVFTGVVGMGVPVKWSEKAAESSLLRAEQCGLEVSIRHTETLLWQRGVRIRSLRADATLYQAARDQDAGFATLNEDYTRLAARYREQWEVALTMGWLFRQGLGIEGTLKKVQDEYDAIKAEKGGQQQGL